MYSLKRITKRIKNNIIKRKNKIFKISKRIKRIKKPITKKGGGIFNSVGSFIFNPDAGKNYSTKSSLLQTITKLDPNRISQQSGKMKPTSFQIYYNYNSPKPLNINLNLAKPILSSLVEMEPHIIIGNMNRYLVVLVDVAPFNKLLWASEFINNSKGRTILSYQSPIPIGREQHNYIIRIYSYPKELPPFTVVDMNTKKRKTEYGNFTTYINNPQYKSKINLVKEFKLNITKDFNVGINLFNQLKIK
jgi:hypothetical protein